MYSCYVLTACMSTYTLVVHVHVVSTSTLHVHVDVRRQEECTPSSLHVVLVVACCTTE